MKSFIASILVCMSLVYFWSINKSNYQTLFELQQNIIQHPEHLPNSKIAEIGSFGFKNIIADIYWIDTIQYIGGNVIGGEYKQYLFAMIDLISDLNPYFEYPYIIGQLLLPNSHIDDTHEQHSDKLTQQAIELGLKGIENFCDPKIIEKITSETDLQKIWNESAYKNPCTSYQIPFYLAFIYYFYDNNPAQAGLYYTIAGANKDSVEGAKILATIMLGKSGNREKSIVTFLNIAKFIEPENQVCQEFAQQVENIAAGVFLGNQPITGQLIQALELSRNQIFGDVIGEDTLLGDTQCSSYVKKAIREFNMAYIESANEVFMSENNGLPARHAQGLFQAGYIDFLPTDHQQYPDKGYGIIYSYDYEKGRYEYSVGVYE